MDDIELNDKKLEPCTLSPITFKYGKMGKRGYFKTTSSSYLLTLEFIVSGKTEEIITKKILKFIHAIENCTIEFDFEKTLIHHCILNKYEKEFVTLDTALLTCEFSDDITGLLVFGELKKGINFLNIGGAVPTFINYKIVALENVTNVSIDNIKIKTLSKGKECIINAENGLITVDDALYTRNVEFEQFREVLGDVKINVSSNLVKVTASYTERY